MFRGRWDAVPGASYYQVWVKNFGRWTFDPNEMQTSPFTSSFELRVMDERARFKVRAIGPKGAESDYSDEVAPVWRKVTTSESEDRATTRTGSSGTPEFDPKAPPPDPPTGLFTIWVEPEVIKLVWQESKGAKNYAVEEYRDGSWASELFNCRLTFNPLFKLPRKRPRALHHSNCSIVHFQGVHKACTISARVGSGRDLKPKETDLTPSSSIA